MRLALGAMAASQHAPLTVQVLALDAVRKVTHAGTLSSLSARLSLSRGSTHLSYVCVCCVQYRRRSCAWQPSPLEKRYCQLNFIMNIVNAALAARRTRTENEWHAEVVSLWKLRVSVRSFARPFHPVACSFPRWRARRALRTGKSGGPTKS